MRLKPAPNAQCRPVLHRLELLAELLRAVPVARPGAGEGFQLEGLMRFLGAAFGSPSADVRAAAVRVAAQVPLRPRKPRPLRGQRVLQGVLILGLSWCLPAAVVDVITVWAGPVLLLVFAQICTFGSQTVCYCDTLP